MKPGEIMHHASGEMVQVLCVTLGRVCIRFSMGAAFVPASDLKHVPGQTTSK